MTSLASAKEAKVRFTAETKDFTSQIKQSNSELTKLRSELKLNAAQANLAGQSIDGLADRQRILTQEMQTQQTKIDALNGKLQSAKAIFGETSPEVQKLETQLNNARVAQTKMQSELNATSAALEDMQAASTQGASALGRMETELKQQESALSQLKSRYNEVAASQGEASDEARQLASQISKASGEVAQARSDFQQASSAADQFDRSLDSVGDSAKDAGDGLGVLDIAMGDFISDAAQGAWDSLSSLEEETRQYRLEQSKLAAQYVQTGKATIDNAAEVSRLSDEYVGFYRLTGDETLSSTAASNLNAMGLSQDNLNNLLTAASGIWAQYGDSIPLDGLAESVNETANVGTVTGSMADALNWAAQANYDLSAAMGGNAKAQDAYNKAIGEGMSAEDAFNEALKTCSTEQERQQLIVDTLYGTYGDLGEAYNTLSNDAQNANQAQAEMTDSMAQLGDAIAPATTQMQYFASDVLEGIATNLPTIVPLVGGLTAALAGMAAVKGISSVVTSISGLGSAMNVLKTVMTGLGGPVAIVVGAIALLAGAFISAYNSNEEFRNGVNQIWTQIQAFLAPIIQSIVTTFQTYWPVIQQTVTNVMNAIMLAVQTVWPIIQQIFTTAGMVIQTIVQTVWPIISQIITTVMTNIQTLIATVWPYIQSLFQTGSMFIQAFVQNVWPIIQNIIVGVMSAVQSVISVAWPVIQAIFQTAGAVIQGVINTVFPVIQGVITTVMGVIQGVIQTVTGIISGDWSAVWNGVSQVASSIWNGISSTISGVINGISSTIGSVMNGISSTISSIWNGIKTTISNAINTAKDTVGSAIDAIKGFFNFQFKWPHIPLPHFSISGSVNPLDWLSQGPPSISVSWYAEGGIMDSPTIFGIAGSTLLGGGEAGPEAIAPIDKLQTYIQEAVDSRMGGMDDLVKAIEDLADRVISVEIDGRQIARATASQSDRVNGARQQLVKRGVSLA